MAYSEVLTVLVILTGSLALKICYFSHEILPLTKVIFPLQKGYILKDDTRQIVFYLLSLQLSNEINLELTL